jgi:hypothetical protein
LLMETGERVGDSSGGPRRAVSALALIASLAPSGLAHAESFAHRVAIAKAAEDDPATAPYQLVMFGALGGQLASIMQVCVGANRADATPFVLVADIRPSGDAVDVDVQPGTPTAKCFAGSFSRLRFPTPPALRNRIGFPIFIEMTIKN